MPITAILKLASKYLPQLIVILVITMGVLFVKGLIEDVDRLTQSVKDRDSKISALNTSVGALASENANKLQQLEALRDYSEQAQADALRMATEYEDRKESLQAELADVYKQLTDRGETPNEIDLCTLSPMPDDFIRLLKRTSAADSDRGKDGTGEGSTARSSN